MRNLHAYPITTDEKLKVIDDTIKEASRAGQMSMGGMRVAALQEIKKDIERFDTLKRTGGDVQRTQG